MRLLLPRPVLHLLVLVLLPLVQVHGYTWSFSSDPKQCTNLTVSISGSGGKGPYRVLVVPFGSSPFSNNTEVRRILDEEFPSAEATEVSFKLKYPANSQFVAVVSDATGFGSGGTSVAAIVKSSDDATCFDASQDVSPDFWYSTQPLNQIVQCQSTRIWWDPTQVRGTPNFLGVIPGGQSFTVPETDLTNVTDQGTGFKWTPNLRGGTTLLLVGGDDRGNGTAGSSLFSVGSGTNNDNSCLDAQSPSSTPGTPAGGSYATSTSGAGTGGSDSGNGSGSGSGNGNSGSSSGGGGTNIGAIVGGVVGGVVALIAFLLVLLFMRRRRRLHHQSGVKPVDLLHEDEAEADERGKVPRYYEPEPFIVPDPTVASDSGHGHGQEERPHSQMGSDDVVGGRKGAMPALRPVNVIQHDDAGPSENEAEPKEEAETVELPPAYTNIRK